MALGSDVHHADNGIAHLVAEIREALARWKLFRETLRELRGLSAKELGDLGLSRSTIRTVAHEAAYGRQR